MQLNTTKNIYKERIVITNMIYLVKKFGHYLLGNTFTFHIDHDALKYMINKVTLDEVTNT